MIGDTFKNLKNYYTEIKVSEKEIDQKWQMLEALLPEQNVSGTSYHYMRYGAVFLGAVLVLLVATIALAQVSKPGNFLYPVNTITQEVAKKITNTFKTESPTVSPPKVPSSVSVIKKIPTPTNKPTIAAENKEIQRTFDKTHVKITPTTSILGTQTKKYGPTPTQAENHKNSVNNSNNSQKENNADTENNSGKSYE